MRPKAVSHKARHHPFWPVVIIAGAACAIIGAILFLFQQSLNGSERPITASDHHLGSLEAPVQLVVYFDLSCPYCQTFHQRILPRLETEFGDKIDVVYRDYPLPRHVGSRKKADVAECVAQTGGEGAFWKFVDAMYADQRTANPAQDIDAVIEGALSVAGIDASRIDACMKSGAGEAAVASNASDGYRAGVSVTPTVIVKSGSDRVKINGEYYSLTRSTIQYLLLDRISTSSGSAH